MPDPKLKATESTRLVVDVLVAKREIQGRVAAGKSLLKTLPIATALVFFDIKDFLERWNKLVLLHKEWHLENAQTLRVIFTGRDIEAAYLSINQKFVFPNNHTKKLSIGNIVGDDFKESQKRMALLWRGVESDISQREEFFESLINRLSGYADTISTSNSLLSELPDRSDSREIFVVHGCNNEQKETVARFLSKLDLNPVILHEQASAGRTIIEKFESHANARFAVILLTADDKGCLASANFQTSLRYRARQNVVFEWGYFTARLGRQNVCALAAPEVERPSEMDGILYISIDGTEAWKLHLAQELKAAGIEINLNKAFS